MAQPMESESKETEAGKKSRIQEKVGKLGSDIDILAKKTGGEASKLAKNINTEIKSISGEIKSIDVKDEVKSITAKVEKLVDTTGDSAKKLASDIKTDVKKLGDKIEIPISKKK
ncbi:hypothetical protein MSBRW_1142 [Methanosarcina barkeri str. Wiesmoor]|uniref:Uncharacterized protein n=2 Tax=Methanosarcina barkeri TaxID=2208 RepID=A0A0E3QI47_METBA|nr:hypothetical protein [Methanosarcina barkeri]AKB50395.1 hypothetical protein MSBRW_1142 [Methanosarcina barkeri str. Wiesmoor]